MRGKNKVGTYVPKALESFGKCMLKVRQYANGKNNVRKVKIDMEGLTKAIGSLEKEDREQIEKFWGLTGGPNHSKRIGCVIRKDIAFKKMQDKAFMSLSKLITIKYLYMYDSNVVEQVEQVASKVDKQGLEIADVECVKYLMAFYLYLLNGPKMSFEDDLMVVDTEVDGSFLFDEAETLSLMVGELEKFKENSISIQLIIDFLDMLDIKDKLAIKKSLGIQYEGDTLSKYDIAEKIEVIKSMAEVRSFKERVFKYGPWETTTCLILKNKDKSINFEKFLEDLDSIKDWNQIEKFKTGKIKLKTLNETRTLDVYTVGEEKFTDVYEIMFLYLERKLITSK